MKLFIFLALIIFTSSVVSCGTKTDSSSSGDVRDASVTTLETSKDPETGAEMASVKSDGTAQEIKVSDSNAALTGTKVAFPANALASNTQIKIEEGASIATETTASLTNNTVKSTGTPVAIQSSIAQDATVPFSVQVGLPAGFELTSATDKYSNLIILYKVKIVAEDKVVVGILPRNAIVIEGSSARFLIKYFGVYQTAIMENEGTVASEIAATKPIATKREETAAAAVVSTPTPVAVAAVAAVVVTPVAAIVAAVTPTPTVAATPTPTSPVMYIAGASSNQAGYLKGDVWTAFTVPSGTTSSTIYTFTVSGSDVSATGQIVNAGITKIGYWTSDLAWHELASLDTATYFFSAQTSSRQVIGTDAYAVGHRIGTPNIIGYLKNSTWTDLSAIAAKNSSSSSLFINGANIYIAGFSNDSGDCSVAGYWLSGVWNALPSSGLSATASYITKNGSDLYITGKVSKTLGYWKNGSWTILSQIDSTKVSTVNSMLFNGTDTYMIGTNMNSSTISIAGYWKNGTWTTVSTTNTTQHSMVISLYINGTDVYAIGTNSMDGLGYWKNGTWTATTITPKVIVIQ